MKVIPASLRQAAIRFCRDVLAERAIARREGLAPSAAPVSLHMVIGHDMLRMGLLALRSFEFHTRQCWAPVIHDDGTMTESDAAELRHHFPDAVIIRRAQADAELATALAGHPVCRENRLKHHWFLKVFDTRHYARHDRYIVMDSDIVFFRRPDFLLKWIECQSNELWLMEDTREKYALAREEIERQMDFPLWKKVNSGLDLMVKAAADLSVAETFLQRCAPMAREYCFLEQTLFCIFGSAWKHGGGLLPQQYEISWTNFRRAAAVCRHYVGPFKNDALFIEGATTFWLQSLGTHGTLK